MRKRNPERKGLSRNGSGRAEEQNMMAVEPIRVEVIQQVRRALDDKDHWGKLEQYTIRQREDSPRHPL